MHGYEKHYATFLFASIKESETFCTGSLKSSEITKFLRIVKSEFLRKLVGFYNYCNHVIKLAAHNEP